MSRVLVLADAGRDSAASSGAARAKAKAKARVNRRCMGVAFRKKKNLCAFACYEMFILAARCNLEQH